MSEGKNNVNCDLSSKVNTFMDKCRKSGLKITPQRIAIFKILAKSKDHPSADMVYRKVKKEMPNISFDTVNRTLLSLCEIGTAFVVESSGRINRFDGNVEDHQHFNCIKCRKIVDFQHKPFNNIEVPNDIERKFKILRKTVYIEGLCDKCK